MVDQALRLPQEHRHDVVAHGRIIHNYEIPALHVGTRRGPAAAINNALQDVPADRPTRLEPPHAASFPDDVLKKRIFRHYRLRLDCCSSLPQYSVQIRAGHSSDLRRRCGQSGEVVDAVGSDGYRSRREVDVDVEAMVALIRVAARVKAGMSARQIAAELGIAETTVVTHRNGAYARIGGSEPP
jgi:hypothetical protein